MFVASDNESKSSMKWSQLCCHFEFGEILSATENFDESLVIGRGGSAKVYKGNIKIGSILVVAAIKRLDMMSNQGESEFWDEVKMLSKLRHCHLVSLIGYCNHQRERILVYEYMPHGTLADHLHKFASPLSWCKRLEICIGVARGLDYLHTGTGTEFGIIHRDLKCSNILLDESCAAKVSDFGLSKISPSNQASTYVSTLVKGTFGYFDPYYFMTGKLNRKSDVYAFGVILLEVLCRKRAVDDTFDWGIATWAQDSIKEGRLTDIVDFDIRSEISSRCLKGFARLAKRCLDKHPKNRPTMAEVILGLEYVLSLQEKTNNLLQTQGKTIFGRMIDMFYFTNNGQKSGMGSKSLMRGKPRVVANFGSLLPKTRMQLMLKQKIFKQEGALLLEHKLKNSVGDLKIFRAEELEKATMNFAEKMILGKGSYGIVYKGILPDKRVVAIKRSKITNQGPLEQFMKEIEVLGQTKHMNVVRLLGCCLETEIPFLAYEFACNYCLHQHIHYKASDTRRLSWDSRLRIAHESAGALAYLHSHATMSIVHGDVKSANILLDENYSAKVSDFDATKSVSLGPDQVFTLVQGTLGYLDPEYLHTSQLTHKSDVYSFGVVLAELLTGLNPMDSERCQEDRILATYFVKAKMENRLLELVDRQVLEEATDEQLEAAYNLVCRCLDSKGGNRPSMKQLTMELKIIRDLRKHEISSEDN